MLGEEKLIVIGVTSFIEWERNIHGVSRNYTRKIIDAGAIPLIIPSIVGVEKVVGKLDAVLFSGGGDIAPRFYNEYSHPGIRVLEGERDELEIILAKKAFEMGKPILGICRGIQLINVAFGGNIFQDISKEVENPIKHDWYDADNRRFRSPPDYPTHRVTISRSSRLFQILEVDNLYVNSFHHQAVKKVAPGFRDVAWAGDNIVEAIEYDGDKFILGIQWHPEMMHDVYSRKIFKAFVEAARK